MKTCKKEASEAIWVKWFLQLYSDDSTRYLLKQHYYPYMWWDLRKSVWNRTCNILSFIFDWSTHLERYILLKTPPESDQWLQSYEQLKGSQNNRKQKEICSFYWLYLTINAPNFRLILLDSNMRYGKTLIHLLLVHGSSPTYIDNWSPATYCLHTSLAIYCWYSILLHWLPTAMAIYCW